MTEIRNWPRVGFLILLFGLAGLNLLYIWKCPLDLCGDEAHYWEWSRHLDICYYSKGPVVAYIIWLATHIGGHTAFAIRVPAVLLSMGSMALAFALGRRLFKSDLAGFLGVLLLAAAPMMNIGAAVLTIDSPLCFFWLVAVSAWHRALFAQNPSRGQLRWWVVGGLCVTVGFLAKFTAIFLLPGLLLFLILSPEDRWWLRRPHPWLAIFCGLLGFAPFLIWNAQHDWVTVRHLLALGGAGRSKLFDPKGVVSIVWTALVISPIIFCFLVYGIWKSTQQALWQKDRAHLFCEVFVWPVLIFYALVGLHKFVPVNWPFTAYLTGMIATGGVLAERLAAAPEHRFQLKKWIIAGVGLGLVISLALRYTYIFYPVMERFGVPVIKDHAALMFTGWRELGARVSQMADEMLRQTGQEPFICSDNYRWSSVLGFYTDKHYPSYFINMGQRHNQYDFWPGIEGFRGRNAIFVGQMTPELRNAFDHVAAPERLPIVRRGVRVKEFLIYRCYGFRGWTPPAKKRRY